MPMLRKQSSSFDSLDGINSIDVDNLPEIGAWLANMEHKPGRPKKGWGKVWGIPSTDSGTKSSLAQSEESNRARSKSKEKKKVQFRQEVSFVEPSPDAVLKAPVNNDILLEADIPKPNWPAMYDVPSTNKTAKKDGATTVKTEPTKKPADPAKKPPEPDKKPSDPSKKPPDPSKKPTDPVKKPPEPDKKPSDPVKKPPESDKKPPESDKKPSDPDKRQKLLELMKGVPEVVPQRNGSPDRTRAAGKLDSKPSPALAIAPLAPSPEKTKRPHLPTSPNSPIVLTPSQGLDPTATGTNEIKVWKGRIFRNCQNGTKVTMKHVAAVNGAQRDLVDLHRAVKQMVSFDFTYRVTLEDLVSQFKGKKLVVCLEVVPGSSSEKIALKEYVEYYRSRKRAGAAVVAKTELLYIMPVGMALQLTILNPEVIAGIVAVMNARSGPFLIGLWAPSRQHKEKLH